MPSAANTIFPSITDLKFFSFFTGKQRKFREMVIWRRDTGLDIARGRILKQTYMEEEEGKKAIHTFKETMKET